MKNGARAKKKRKGVGGGGEGTGRKPQRNCIVAAALSALVTYFAASVSCVELSPLPHPPLPSLSFLLLSPYFSCWKKTLNIPVLCLSLFPNQRKTLATQEKRLRGRLACCKKKKNFRTCFLFLSWEVYIDIYISGNQYFNEISFFPYYSVCAHCSN